MKYLIKNGTLVTLDSDRSIFAGDLLICNNRIQQLGVNIDVEPDTQVIDASNQFVIPGFIQAHTHLCQALFRGQADDLPLLEWLEKRIWPMEHAHNDRSLRASAQIAILEMHKLGTTTVLDMATVHHTQALLETVEQNHMRYWGGKCLMDLKNFSGPLYQKTDEALRETLELLIEWRDKSSLIEYALCPRFAISCSKKLMKKAHDLKEEYGVFMHTHASESRQEVDIIKKRTGHDNIDYLDKLELLDQKTVIVHGVHMNKRERTKMVKRKTPLVHCPSANLKLASGIAPVDKYLKEGLTIGLGSDGAACNNTMDPFLEMRLAALIQKPLFGPEALPAQMAFEMATLGGARVLGVENQMGSLEVGKWADVVTVDRSHPSVSTVENAYSALVYSCSGRDVKNVFVHGKPVVLDGDHQILDENRVIAQAKEELTFLQKRL